MDAADVRQLTAIIEAVIRDDYMPHVRAEASRMIENMVIPEAIVHAEAKAREVARAEARQAVAELIGRSFHVALEEIPDAPH